MLERFQNLKAILFVTAGFALFSLNDALIKILAQNYSVPQTLFWASIFVCLVLVCYALLFEGRHVLRTERKAAHFWRGFLMGLMVLCNIFALTQLKLTDFYAIMFLSPLMVSFLSWMIFKDSLKKRQIITILFGFCVILYMCRPGSGLFNIGALAVFMSALFFAFATLFLRSNLKNENPLLLGISGPIVMVMIALPAMAWFGFALPQTPQDLILFVLTGVAAGFGGVFFGLGFQIARSAAVVAPFHYTQMIWGAVLGYLIFAEIPAREVVIGSILLAGLGIYLIYSEAKLKEYTLAEKENLTQHGPIP